MAITLNTGRQETVSARVSFSYTNLTSGVAVNAIQLPANARIIGAFIRIETAFNSGTSDALVIQSNEGTPKAYITIPAVLNTLSAGTVASADGILSNVVTVASNIGFLNTQPSFIDVKWTGTGTAATTGAATLEVEYVVENRAAFTQG